MSAYGDLTHIGSEIRYQRHGQPQVCLFYGLASDGTHFLKMGAMGRTRVQNSLIGPPCHFCQGAATCDSRNSQNSFATRWGLI